MELPLAGFAWNSAFYSLMVPPELQLLLSALRRTSTLGLSVLFCRSTSSWCFVQTYKLQNGLIKLTTSENDFLPCVFPQENLSVHIVIFQHVEKFTRPGSSSTLAFMGKQKSYNRVILTRPHCTPRHIMGRPKSKPCGEIHLSVLGQWLLCPVQIHLENLATLTCKPPVSDVWQLYI